MDKKLQELVSRLEIISDVRNRDRSNFVTFSFEHPKVETPKDDQAVNWTILASQLEPIVQAGAPLPINLIWICYDSTSSDYKKVFKRRTTVPNDGYKSTWLELNEYDEIFEEPQYFEFDPALIGSRGERGEKGDQGPRGETGFASTVPGPKGDPGERGLQGDRGIEGARGPQGFVGQTGPRGERGEQGLKGDRGEQGVKGDQGPRGETGLKGDKGDRGEQGLKGDQGVKGDTGAASTVPGPKGEKGEQGPRGETGLKGDRGETGLAGGKGDRGEQGLKGDKGDKGDRGEQGIKGDTGAKGEQGIKGDTGAKGDRGEQGIKGDRGEQGIKGEDGKGIDLAASSSGMIPFTIADAEINFSYERIVQNRAIIENAEELDKAKTVSTSLADIFNSWRRFSHNGNQGFPANVSEISSWSYNSITDVLKSTINSVSFIGFVSDTAHEFYSHVVTLSSTNNDDDTVAVILAFYIDPVTKKEYTLSAIRTAGGNDAGNPFSIYYNYSQSDAYRLAVVNNTILKTYTNGAGGGSGGAATGWAGGRATKIFATRSGNQFKVRTTQLYKVGVESDEYIAAADLTVDLGSDSRLAKFIGPRVYGYGCLSQADASFSSIKFTQNNGSIFDVRNSDVWNFDALTGSYVLSNEKMDTALPRSRLYWNASTRKLFYYPEGDVIQCLASPSPASAPTVKIPYDLAACHIGKLSADAIISRYVALRAFKFTVGMVESVANAETAPTAQVVMSIRKNGSQFATVTFAPNSKVGVFACLTETEFAPNDVLSIQGPSTADTTFATSSYTLSAVLIGI